MSHSERTLIARFMGPTWVPPLADRTQVGPMWVPWTLPYGNKLVSMWVLEAVIYINAIIYTNAILIGPKIIIFIHKNPFEQKIGHDKMAYFCLKGNNFELLGILHCIFRLIVGIFLNDILRRRYQVSDLKWLFDNVSRTTIDDLLRMWASMIACKCVAVLKMLKVYLCQRW